MWEMIKNEWRLLGRSRILTGLSAGFGLLLLLSMLLGVRQSIRQEMFQQQANAEVRRDWDSIKAMNPHSAAHYGTYLFKPTNWLSSLDEGVQGITGNVLRIEGHVQNEMVHSEASQMQSVSRFGKLKSALILQYILPVMLIFLAFSAVSSEKQSGRWSLLLLQGARPLHLLIAKTLAVWLYGLMMLSIVILGYGWLDFAHIDDDMLQRVVCFGGVYALYYFIITGLTVCLSAWWAQATPAMTAMLGIWILWTIFLPNIFLSASEKWHPLPSRNVMKAAMKEDRAKGIDGHNPADEREEALKKEVLAKYGVDSLSQLPVNFDGIVMQADEEYGNQVWDKHFGHIRQVLTLQKRSLQWLGAFDPFVSLQNASMGLMTTDNLHHQEFLLQAETYRRAFVKLLNDKQAYGGSKTGDWDWTADNAFYRSVPDFQYTPAPLRTVWRHYAWDIGLLAGWALLVLGLLGYSAQKIQAV